MRTRLGRVWDTLVVIVVLAALLGIPWLFAYYRSYFPPPYFDANTWR